MDFVDNRTDSFFRIYPYTSLQDVSLMIWQEHYQCFTVVLFSDCDTVSNFSGICKTTIGRVIEDITQTCDAGKKTDVDNDEYMSIIKRFVIRFYNK